jgi:hypothetical protein
MPLIESKFMRSPFQCRSGLRCAGSEFPVADEGRVEIQRVGHCPASLTQGTGEGIGARQPLGDRPAAQHAEDEYRRKAVAGAHGVDEIMQRRAIDRIDAPGAVEGPGAGRTAGHHHPLQIETGDQHRRSGLRRGAVECEQGADARQFVLVELHHAGLPQRPVQRVDIDPGIAQIDIEKYPAVDCAQQFAQRTS